MITFLVCLALLVTAYFTYGRYLERLVGIDPAARTPCSRLYDGVDYVPLPRWRIFLIQLLNIAGLGPIFGAVLGAAYGPVAFLWITFGGIFMGAAHDFIAGVISLRHDGASLPETAGVYLGGGMKIVMRLFSAGLMILVGAVFLSQPASLVAARLDVPSLEGIAFGGFSWLLLIVLGVILVYYIAATLLPVDKIIGRIYPVFGFALLFMAVGILVVLLFGDRNNSVHINISRACDRLNCLISRIDIPRMLNILIYPFPHQELVTLVFGRNRGNSRTADGNVCLRNYFVRQAVDKRYGTVLFGITEPMFDSLFKLPVIFKFADKMLYHNSLIIHNKCLRNHVIFRNKCTQHRIKPNAIVSVPRAFHKLGACLRSACCILIKQAADPDVIGETVRRRLHIFHLVYAYGT